MPPRPGVDVCAYAKMSRRQQRYVAYCKEAVRCADAEANAQRCLYKMPSSRFCNDASHVAPMMPDVFTPRRMPRSAKRARYKDVIFATCAMLRRRSRAMRDAQRHMRAPPL